LGPEYLINNNKDLVMKSPFTGGATKLKNELRVIEYRNDKFEVIYHYYLCVDSVEQFTTTAIDTLNVNRVYNKYQEKYGSHNR